MLGQKFRDSACCATNIRVPVHTSTVPGKSSSSCAQRGPGDMTGPGRHTTVSLVFSPYLVCVSAKRSGCKLTTLIWQLESSRSKTANSESLDWFPSMRPQQGSCTSTGGSVIGFSGRGPQHTFL